MGFQSAPSNGYTIYVMGSMERVGNRFKTAPQRPQYNIPGIGRKLNYLNNDTLIAGAITNGIDEDGEELDTCMPRWQLGQNDLGDLIAYLKMLEIQEK